MRAKRSSSQVSRVVGATSLAGSMPNRMLDCLENDPVNKKSWVGKAADVRYGPPTVGATVAVDRAGTVGGMTCVYMGQPDTRKQAHNE